MSALTPATPSYSMSWQYLPQQYRVSPPWKQTTLHP
jgi:hypothetical protein